MAFLKRHLLMIVFAVVAVASLGSAVGAYLAGDGVNQQMQAVEQLRSEVQRLRSSAENLETIESRKKRIEEENAELARSLESALAAQTSDPFTGRKRELLIPEILPEPKSSGDQINFKTAYQRAFEEMMARTRGRDHANAEEIREQRAIIENKDRPVGSEDKGPWGPVSGSDGSQSVEEQKQEKTLAEFLQGYPKARAAEQVAKSIYMYIDRKAVLPHPMVNKDDTPDEIQIWHAQMTLWIQQDLISGLVRLNEARARKLVAEGREADVWVAHMPVKRLEVLAIRGRLGRGGGSNQRVRFGESFTGQENDKTKFIVPLQLQLVIEEASLMQVVDSLCEAGYYTPTRIDYRMVPPNPLQTEYIYGEDPVIQLTIDLEGYFFRDVFEDWIPESLKEALKTPGAAEPARGRS